MKTMKTNKQALDILADSADKLLGHSMYVIASVNKNNLCNITSNAGMELMPEFLRHLADTIETDLADLKEKSN
jgi:hypothetical protein